MFGILRSRLLERDISRRFTGFFLLFLLVLSCVAMVYSAQAFQDRIDAVRASDSDNAGWLISQLDVDHKALALTIDRTLMADSYPQLSSEPYGLELVRLRFDIFYSRVTTVRSSLLREPISDQLRDRLRQLDETRTSLATEVSTLVEDDAQALLRFAARVQQTGAVVRDITTMALQFHVAQSHLAQEMERSLLKNFWTQSIVLLVLMVVSAVLAVRLWRELETRTVMMHRALNTASKVFDVSLSAVVISDLQGRIQMANPAASRIFGVPTKQIEGKLIEEVMIPVEKREIHRRMLEQHRMTGHRRMIGSGPVRLQAVRMDGSPFDAEVAIAEDHGLDGRPILIGFIRDISEVVAAEEKLLDARDEAQRHASAKTMFLATMSHEMRTPLHGVIASLDLIDDHQLDAETRLLLQTARDCSDRALDQINNVLQITRLGEGNLGMAPFSPVAVANDILRELTPIAAARGTSITLLLDGQGTDKQFLGLAYAFSRALYNLAGNAVKFTDQGQVVIALTFQPSESDATSLRVEVRDTGIGIASKDQIRIFAEFETIGTAPLGRDSGTGLGLPIVRLAVERMGGTLALCSAPGKGSSFSFEIRLPYAAEMTNFLDAPDEAPPLRDAYHVPERALDVLVVDDNSINVTLMSKMVTRLGHQPTLAHNGLEAVATAASRPFDVILMDVSMPVMDGREATLRIRTGGASSKAAIIGVTAFSETERLADLTAVGMDTVLTKPVDTKGLAAALERVLAEQAANQPEMPKAPALKTGDFDDALFNLDEMLGRKSALRFLEEALQEVDARIADILDHEISLEVLADRLHAAVGSTAVVGLSQISALLKQAENAARKGDRSGVTDSQGQIVALFTVEISCLTHEQDVFSPCSGD